MLQVDGHSAHDRDCGRGDRDDRERDCGRDHREHDCGRDHRDRDALRLHAVVGVMSPHCGLGLRHADLTWLRHAVSAVCREPTTSTEPVSQSPQVLVVSARRNVRDDHAVLVPQLHRDGDDQSTVCHHDCDRDLPLYSALLAARQLA